MSDRRNFLKYSAGGLASLVSGDALNAKAGSKAQNHIFLYIDDLNDYVGFMGGYQDTHTPNMNALAEQGTAFLNAHAVVPACNPSRVSTLFGVDPTKSGAYTNNDHYWDMPYLNDKKSIFRHLGENGFQVYGGGKLFHSSWEPHNDVDWDEFYTSNQRLEANYALTENSTNLDISGVTNELNALFPHDFGPHGSDKDYADNDVATWAEQKIANAPDGFVIGVGFEKPHFPFVVPKEYFDLYNNNQVLNPAWKGAEDIQDLPRSAQDILNNSFSSNVIPFLEREGRTRDHVHAYLASISFVDEMVGKVVRAWGNKEIKHNHNNCVRSWSISRRETANRETIPMGQSHPCPINYGWTRYSKESPEFSCVNTGYIPDNLSHSESVGTSLLRWQ